MTSHNRFYFFYILYDLLSVTFSLLISAYIVAEVSNQTITFTIVDILLLGVLVNIMYLAVGLYERKMRENVRSLFRRIFIGNVLAFAVFEILFLLSLFTVTEPMVLITFMLTGLLTLFVRYYGVLNGGIKEQRRRVLIVGAGERANFIARRMRRKVDRKHFDLIGFVSLSNNVSELIKNKETFFNVDVFDQNNHTINFDEIDTIVLANESKDTLPIERLLDLRMSGITIINFNNFIESELKLIEVETIKAKWLVISDGFTFDKLSYLVVNKVLNITLALLLLIVASPIMLLTMLAIYLDDGRKQKASFLYRQERVGLHGKTFNILKFRSMGVNAESNGAQWASKNDMRVTRIGGFLRKYRIDELPQIFNVLRGDMVFVGPRPERPIFVNDFEKNIPFFKYRHAVKPGLTGWAQLNYPYGASPKDSLEKLKFDLYYVKHRSLLLDIFILIRTVEIVLFGRGR